MATLVHSFAAVIPAGTPQAAPVTIALPFADALVRQIDIEFPPGPRGTVGVRLTTAGLQVYPVIVGQWLVSDGRVFTFVPPDDTAVSAWNLTGYNTGQYNHTIYALFHADPLGTAATPGPITYLDSDTLSSPNGAGTDTIDTTMTGGNGG